MGNKKAQGRLSARRVATFLAALGVLVMSSGLALMVTATPANATQPDPNHKDWICKYVGKPGVDERLKGGKNPIWVDTAATTSGWFNDGQERSWVILADAPKDPAPSVSECPQPESELGQATATATAIQPTCANDNVASYTKSGTHVASWSESAAPAPGTTITVTAHAEDGYAFNGADELDIPLTFDPAEEGCDENPPIVLTPRAPSFTDATCTTPATITLPQQIEVPSRAAAGPVVASSNANGIHYVATGSLAPGGTVEVDATAIDEGTTLGDAVHHWTFHVSTPANCSTVDAPTPQVESNVVVSPPKAHTKAKAHAQAATVTPTVVEAGLASTTAENLRGEQGLALVFAGMVMLLAAGGLGLRVRGAAARI